MLTLIKDAPEILTLLVKDKQKKQYKKPGKRLCARKALDLYSYFEVTDDTRLEDLSEFLVSVGWYPDVEKGHTFETDEDAYIIKNPNNHFVAVRKDNVLLINVENTLHDFLVVPTKTFEEYFSVFT